MRKFNGFALAVLLFTLVTYLTAEVPEMINYQGRLTDSEGTPVADETYEVTFRIYDESSTERWSETHNVVTTDGLFSVQLGSGASPLDASIFGYSECWLGMTITGEDEITPRVQLVAVPYAYRVSTIDGATGGSVSGRINKTRFGAGAVNNGGSVVVADLTGMNMEHGQIHFGNTISNQWVDMWFIWSNNFLVGNYLKFDGSATTFGHFRMSVVSSGVIVYSNTNEGNSAGYAYWEPGTHDILIYESSAANDYCEYWYRDWSNAQ